MKKYYLMAFCALLLLVTGCGKESQVICSKTETEEGKTMTMEVVVNFDKKDKAKDATFVYNFGDKETTDTFCEVFKKSTDASKISCTDTTVTITDIDNMGDEDVDSKKIAGQDKDEFIKDAIKEGFTCK